MRLSIEINHFKFKSSVHLKMTLELSSRQTIVRHQIDVQLVVFARYCAADLTLDQIKVIAVDLVAQIEDHRVRVVPVVVPVTRLEHSISSTSETRSRILFHQLYKSK